MCTNEVQPVMPKSRSGIKFEFQMFSLPRTHILRPQDPVQVDLFGTEINYQAFPSTDECISFRCVDTLHYPGLNQSSSGIEFEFQMYSCLCYDFYGTATMSKLQ